MAILLNYFWRWSVLILLGLLVYGQTFHFDFVFDDYLFIVNNPDIKDFSHVYLIWHTFPMTRLVGFYSFALNYFFNQLHPQGYHIFNFIIHLLAAGLVWVLADLLFKITKFPQDRITKELPFFIALLFLVHPCQTQAVSYISQRFESMATVFYLGTMGCYLSARISTGVINKILLFCLAGCFTLLGILTKEVVITTPLMILASEWILFPRKDQKKFYVVLIVAGVLLYLLFSKILRTDLSIFLQTTVSQSHDGDVLGPWQYFLTQMRVFLTFLRILVLPIHQNLDYDYPASTGFLHPPLTLVGACVISAFIYLIVKLRRKTPLIAYGLAWVLITFSINLAPRANVIFEHKLYLISFGFFLALVVFLSNIVRDRMTLLRILICLVAVLAIVSYQRNKVWKNVFTLWNDTVQKSPRKARPYGNRGTMYYNQGEYTEAMSDFNNAIALNPEYTEAYNNRGGIYYKQGNFVQAMSDYNKAIALNPRYVKAYLNRGAIYDQQGDLSLALSDYNKCIELDPGYAEAYNNRGIIYGKQGMATQAMTDFNKSIEINPEYAEAFYNRGFLCYLTGDFTRAIDNFNKAIELNPQYTDAYKNRAKSYYQLKEYDQAWEDVHRLETVGVTISPKFINALKTVSGKNE